MAAVVLEGGYDDGLISTILITFSSGVEVLVGRQAQEFAEPKQREAEIQNDIRLAISADRTAVLWRNKTGVARHGSGRDERVVKYGLVKGGSDLIGCLRSSGRFIALEVKRPGEKPSNDQVRFLECVRRWGGFGAVVDSVASARAAIGRAARGESA